MVVLLLVLVLANSKTALLPTLIGAAEPGFKPINRVAGYVGPQNTGHAVVFLHTDMDI
jgi:hypothetical protein